MGDMYADSFSEVGIDSVLAAGEEVLWKGVPKKSAYVATAVLKMLPIAVLWLAIDITFITVMVTSGAFSQIKWLLIVIVPFFMIHLAPVWIWIYNIVKASKGHKNVEYAVTDRRIIEKSGLVGINFTSVYYKEVSSVDVKVGTTDKMLHVGDIVVKGSSATVIVCDQEKPYDVLKLIQQCVTGAQNGGKKKTISKCSYCGAMAEGGTFRCPNCNAAMTEETIDVV